MVKDNFEYIEDYTLLFLKVRKLNYTLLSVLDHIMIHGNICKECFYTVSDLDTIIALILYIITKNETIIIRKIFGDTSPQVLHTLTKLFILANTIKLTKIAQYTNQNFYDSNNYY